MAKVKHRQSLVVAILILTFIYTTLTTPVRATVDQNLSVKNESVENISAQKVLIKGDSYQIPAILTLPESKILQPLPIVMMLHGTASNKNEVGNLYKRMAVQLAENNIASIRFDFSGSGESSVDYRLYDLESAINDVLSVYQFIQQQKNIQRNAIHLLGFSQGGLIAQLAAVHPKLPVKSMVTWSTVAGNGISSFKPFFDEYQQEAKENGFAAIKYSWLAHALNFSDKWFSQIRHNTSLTQMANYQGSLLSIAGEADKTVPWSNSLSLVKGAKQAKASLYLIKNANHIYNILAKNSSKLNNDQAITDELLGVTRHFFTEQVAK
jgi:dipeptidyl aminopeptidase/acylaminoacyl peptidase